MNSYNTKKANGRRGFTLVEAIVSILIVTAISLAALTATLTSSDIIRRADDRNRATDQVEMIMACYRTDNFSGALALCGIENYTGGNFTVYYSEDFQVLGLIQPTNNDYYCRVEVTVGQNSIGVTAINRASGEVYYKTEEWLG